MVTACATKHFLSKITLLCNGISSRCVFGQAEGSWGTVFVLVISIYVDGRQLSLRLREALDVTNSAPAVREDFLHICTGPYV